jgi:Family of unknown function (DUF6153)
MRAPGRQVRQVLLLCALALGVVGMHHLAAPPDGMSHGSCHETHAETPVAAPLASADCGTGAGHGLLHLCMAVLGGSVLLLLGWLLLAVSAGLRGSSTEVRAPGWLDRRVRRPAARSLLTFACVWRI